MATLISSTQSHTQPPAQLPAQPSLSQPAYPSSFQSSEPHPSESTHRPLSTSLLTQVASKPLPAGAVGTAQPATHTIPEPAQHMHAEQDERFVAPSGDNAGYQALNCACGTTAADGTQIMQCEKCASWSHIRCAGLTARSAKTAVFKCHICKPNPLRKPANLKKQRIAKKTALKQPRRLPPSKCHIHPSWNPLQPKVREVRECLLL